MMTNDQVILMTQNQNFKLGVVRGDTKYIINMLSFFSEAYNLTLDPTEQNNLIKNQKDERFYYQKYGQILVKWYNCQKKYYEKKQWRKGNEIKCPTSL